MPVKNPPHPDPWRALGVGFVNVGNQHLDDWI
jgi:hypothetical protein